MIITTSDLRKNGDLADPARLRGGDFFDPVTIPRLVFHPPKEEVGMSIFLLLLHLVTAGARLGSDPDGLVAVLPELTSGNDGDARLGSDPNG